MSPLAVIRRRCATRFGLGLSAAILWLSASDARPAAKQTVIWQEAESLVDAGGWSNDPQHVDIMGSPYLLATGIGRPVKDAVGPVVLPHAGRYTLWVRCRDWFPSHSPGQFQVFVNGKSSPVVFGKADNDDWRWVNGGAFELPAGKVELRVHDLTGWWGRVDALVLSTGDFKPADDLETLAEQRAHYGGVSPNYRDLGPFDVVVVGGGPSGMGAALGAARNGAKVAFIQDRPVLGGNGSDEIMVPPMGYIGNPPDKVNVTGVAEELYPPQGWSNFGSSAHYKRLIDAETNISLFLNTRATGVEMKDAHTIAAVLALNVRSGQRLRFTAPLFIDTTGHGWIGYFAGAVYRMGTEARSEFGESMAPQKANPHTMGNSLYKATFKDMGKPVPFATPAWAYQWKRPEDFHRALPRIKQPIRPKMYEEATRGPGRSVDLSGLKMAGAFTWYIEYGGMLDTVWDAERIRDELFRIHVGLWGYVKNHAPGAEQRANLAMVWLNYVPGVRESRRLIGDYILTQHDYDKPVQHPDTVAFSDWGIDDHHPLGYFTDGIDAMHVYEGRRVCIPYRCLYSTNIHNLFMAGRCLSASHLGLAGVRVQRPMAATGQAAGTAAAIAARERCLPREVLRYHLDELQQRLLRDGCYLPGIKNHDPDDLALRAKTRFPSLIDGWNREIEGVSRAVPWSQPLDLTLAEPAVIGCVHVSLRDRHQRAAFDVEVLGDGRWKTVTSTKGLRRQRRYVLNFPPLLAEAVRLHLRKASGPVAVTEVRIYRNHHPTTEIPALEQEVAERLPGEQKDMLGGLVIDESQARLVGAWKRGIYTPVYGDGYLHDDNKDKGAKGAIFAVTVPRPGSYEVRLLYRAHANRASNTPVTLNIDGIRHSMRVDQRTSDGLGAVLGVFPIRERFELSVSNRDTDGYVILDGVQLRPVSDGAGEGNHGPE